jgi:hypothetical protein
MDMRRLIEAVDGGGTRWKFYDEFRQEGMTLTPGQRVRVQHHGFVGSSLVYQTVTKVSDTQITLDDGHRYSLVTGDRVGSFAKAETRPRILKVGPVKSQ